MVRNTSNLRWFAEPNAPVKLSIDPYPIAGSLFPINLEIKELEDFSHIKNIIFEGFSPEYSQHNLRWHIGSPLPYVLNTYIQLPNTSFSIYPTFHIEGWNGSAYRWTELEFRRPIISTTFNPIFDARLAASNSIRDKSKIQPLKKLLHISGFDTSTLGVEVQAPVDFGEALLESEKEWASSGDCFIAILTRRYNSDNGEGIIPGWIHTEAGLSYSKGRPQFAFVEKEAKMDALYKYLDDDHIIQFDPDNLLTISDQFYKISNFRTECNNRRFGQGLRDAGLITVGAFTFIGIAALFEKLFGSKDRY